jgi:hypothetical protein
VEGRGGVEVAAVREDEVDRSPEEGELGWGRSAWFKRTLTNEEEGSALSGKWGGLGGGNDGEDC